MTPNPKKKLQDKHKRIDLNVFNTETQAVAGSDIPFIIDTAVPFSKTRKERRIEERKAKKKK